MKMVFTDKTSSDNVEYLEYQIDFTRISPHLSDIPTTAYENGGNLVRHSMQREANREWQVSNLEELINASLLWRAQN